MMNLIHKINWTFALFFAILFQFSAATAQQRTVEISGNVTGVKDSTIISLMVASGNVSIGFDNDTIINGRFKFVHVFKESDQTPQKLSLSTNNDPNKYGSITFWASPGKTTIRGEGGKTP